MRRLASGLSIQRWNSVAAATLAPAARARPSRALNDESRPLCAYSPLASSSTGKCTRNSE